MNSKKNRRKAGRKESYVKMQAYQVAKNVLVIFSRKIVF